MENTQTLKSFFKDAVAEKEPIKYVASKRFKDEKGNPIEWQLKALDTKDIEKIMERNTKRVPIPGTRDFKKETNHLELNKEMAVSAIVFPNLDDAELQDSWGAVGAKDLLEKMLTYGELSDLILANLQAQDIETGFDEKLKK